MNFDLYSTLKKELDKMEKDSMNALKTLEKYKGEFNDEEYLEGINKGSLETIKMIKKIIEVYKN